MEVLKEAWVQAGAYGLLIAVGYFWIKDLRDQRSRSEIELKAERARNDAVTDRAFAVLEANTRTLQDLTSAVRGVHP